MNSNQWLVIKQAFQALVELPAEQREAMIKDLRSRADFGPRMHAELLALLNADRRGHALTQELPGMSSRLLQALGAERPKD